MPAEGLASIFIFFLGDIVIFPKKSKSHMDLEFYWVGAGIPNKMGVMSYMLCIPSREMLGFHESRDIGLSAGKLQQKTTTQSIKTIRVWQNMGRLLEFRNSEVFV